MDGYVEVWNFDCPYIGSFVSSPKGGKRHCRKDGDWKLFEECLKCKERLKYEAERRKKVDES